MDNVHYQKLIRRLKQIPLVEIKISVMLPLTPPKEKKKKESHFTRDNTQQLLHSTPFKPDHLQFRPSSSLLQLARYGPLSHDCHHHTNDAARQEKEKATILTL